MCLSVIGYLVGWAVLPGAVIMMILAPLNYYCSLKFETVEEKILNKSESRVNLIGELLQGILVVKLFTWEEKLKERVCYL